MRRQYRWLLALLAGTVAGVLSYVGVIPILDSSLTWFTVGLNTVVWVVAVGLYAFVYEQLESPEGRPDWERQRKNMTLGGIAGLVASLGTTGTIGLLTATVSIRFGATMALFVFGIVLASMAVGMQSVIWRFGDRTGGPTVAGRSQSEESTEPSD